MRRPFFIHLLVIAAVTIGGLEVSAQGPDVPAHNPRVTRVSPNPIAPPRPLIPGTRASAFTMIQGNALTATNGHLADGVVRLRDARSGRIVDVEMTDKSGLFGFRSVDPGAYVVELMGNDQGVLAASQLLSVGAGEVVSALVKLPWSAPLGGLLGPTAPSAVTVSSAAAASGVLATAVTGQPVSPNK